MVDPSIREYLIGYLLGALDEDEQQLVEESLAVDENLRRELGLLSRALAPLDSTFEEYAPPSNLAARTCEMVEAYREGILSEETAEEPIAAELSPAKSVTVASILAEVTFMDSSPNRSTPVGTRRRMRPVSSVPRAKVTDWRWQDLAVSAAVIGLILITLTPGLLHRREDARVLACQDNLGNLGHLLTDYSDRNDGFFPQIPTSGNMSTASAFAPILLGAELLPDPKILLCPDSSLSGKFSKNETFRVPHPTEISQIDSSEELLKTQETMGGNYGYSLGYYQNGTYRPTENLRRSYFAVLSDAPGNAKESQQPDHHGGRGQNVLFEDGHVLFITQARTAGGRDNLFLNDANQIAAGLHPNDAVIAAGAVTP